MESCPFEIGEDLCAESLWKVLNFFYCERCGFPVPGKHGACHQDILAHHNGVTMSFSGGLHDAGDVSQQAAQTGEAVQALFENARRCKAGSPLYLRLMEEAQWGLDFILRTRFGYGARVTHAFGVHGAPPEGGLSTAQWCAQRNIRPAESMEQLVAEVDAIMVIAADNSAWQGPISCYSESRLRRFET